MGKLNKYILEIVNKFILKSNAESVYISNSNDFSIEKMLSKTSLSIYGSDVNFLSSNVGNYFASKELSDLIIKNEYQEKLKFILDFMETDLDKLATLLLLEKIVPYIKNENLYSKRMLNNYRLEFKKLHEKQKQKIFNTDLKLTDFYNLNTVDFVGLIPNEENSLVIINLANNKADLLKDIFVDNIASSAKVNENDLMSHIVNKQFKFVIITNQEMTYFRNLKQAEIKNSKSIYIYSNIETEKLLIDINKKSKENNSVATISQNDKIENVEIKELSKQQFNTLRSIYIGKNVKNFANAQICYGLFSNNKLFGAFGFATDYIFKAPTELEKPALYLLSDFSVSPTNIKHLSKLILYCVLSKEVKLLAERFLLKEVKTVYTTVFTDKNSSMKYRNLFKLYNRKTKNNQSVALGYYANTGQWTLKEGYEKWKHKL